MTLQTLLGIPPFPALPEGAFTPLYWLTFTPGGGYRTDHYLFRTDTVARDTAVSWIHRWGGEAQIRFPDGTVEAVIA